MYFMGEWVKHLDKSARASEVNKDGQTELLQSWRLYCWFVEECSFNFSHAFTFTFRLVSLEKVWIYLSQVK